MAVQNIKLTILSAVCLGAGNDAYPGDTPTVTDPLGRALISRGKAKLYEASDDKKPEEKPAKASDDKKPEVK
jgi:hypothetical protein